MKLSVIIPTFNRRALILQTLPTVLDQTFPANDYEVIIVIDGSTDGTAEALKQIASAVRISVIEQENHGQAAARNVGLKAATGELVLFLDDDLFCEHNLIAEHVSAHVDGNLMVFGPVLVASQSPESLATKWLRIETNDRLSQLEHKGVSWPDNAIVSPNSSVRRHIIVASGGFDERFFRAFEDWELGYRLWKTGLRFHYCSSALTHQYYTKSSNDYILRDAVLWGAKEVLFCQKHPEMRIYSTMASKKSTLFNYCARLPFSIDPLLRLFEVCARTDSAGINALVRRLRFSMHRSAIKAAGGWRQFERDYAMVLPVLLYHHVGPVQPGTYPALTVAPERFEKQMSWLKRNGYTTIRTADWLAWCLEGKSLPPKPVLLTFDDAYADLVEYAFPVLRKHDFTATVFVVTGEIGGENSWDKRSGSAAIRCMNVDEIKRWSGEGIEFGAHTRTHPDLTTLSEHELEEEIAGSGRELAVILGKIPSSFAFPFGAYNSIVQERVKKSYQLAFTSDEGLNDLATHPHTLRRIMIQPGYTLLDFALNVEHGFNPIERLRARIGLRTRMRKVLRTLQGS